MLLISLLLTLSASADVRFEAFALKADNSFEVQYSAPTPQVARGVINNAMRIKVEGAEVTTTVQPFGSAFILLTFIKSGEDLGQVILLEQVERGRFARLHHQAILGNATTLLKDLDGIFADLRRLNSWDPSLVIRAMVSFFDAQPGRRIKDFYDAVELGHLRTVAKPDPRGSLPTRQTRRRAETIAPRERENETTESLPKRRSKKEREPQPWEPRRHPSQGQRPAEMRPRGRVPQDYFPGQQIQTRRTKPKTLLDLILGQ